MIMGKKGEEPVDDFAQEGTLSVINIRIASVPAKSQQAVKDRLNRTMLTDDDLIELMKCAIETTQDYGTYYGVSNHLHKPWSTWNAHIAECVGPSFIKSIGGPLSHVKMMPTGGVNLDTIEAFIRAGAVAVGAGGSLLNKQLIEKKVCRLVQRHPAGRGA